MKNINQELLDRLLMNNVNIDFKTFVNFDSDSTFLAEEDLSKYVEKIKISKKLEGNLGVNVTDNATITLTNEDNIFSPKNTSSPYAGNLVPNKYVRLEGGIPDSTALLFDGEIKDINPNYRNTQVSFKVKDITSRLKNVQCPDVFYEQMYREEIIKELLDYAGGLYTEDTIDKTNAKVNAYFKGQTVWDAVQQLARSVWGRLYVEGGLIYFRTRLSPDYTSETNVVKTLDNDDYFEIKETYTSNNLYNEVSIKSAPLKKQAERVVWRSSQNNTSVSEQYNVSDIDSNNQLQLQESIDGTMVDTTNVPINNGSLSVTDRSTGIEYNIGNGGLTVDYSTGLITFTDNADYPVPTGEGKLDVGYSYNINILEPNRSREFLINLDNPTTNLSNIHYTVENLTDDVKMVPRSVDRTIRLRGNSRKTIDIYEPHTISWDVDYQDGADHRRRSGSYTFTEAQLGTCTIKTNVRVDRPWHDYDDYYMDFQIVASNGDVVVSNSEHKGEHRLERPTTINLKINYNHYEYDAVPPPSPDIDVSTDIYPNQKTVGVKIDNTSDKKIRLHGYLKDEDNTTEDMILLGTPYTTEEQFEYTKQNEDSVSSFGLNAMGEVQNDYLLTQNDLKQLGDYLLYQYSTPMTVLDVECKPMPQLEIMDKIRIIQEDRDIDDIFFIEEIEYTHSKNDPFGMKLKLKQAYQSDFVFNDDGSYVIIGGGESNESITKPSKVGVLNAETISASIYGDNKVKLTWDYNKEYNVSHYNIYRKDHNDTSFIYIGQSKKGNLRYVDSILDYNTTYEYKITAVDKTDIESDLSNSVSVTTKLGDQPPAPTLEDSIFTDEVYLEWTEVDEADRYELRNDTNFGVNDSGLLYRGQETSTIVNNPTSRNVTYYLKSINDNENYSKSYATISLENTAPPKPKPPQVLEFFEGLWINIPSVNDKDLQGYRVYITSTSTSNTDVITLPTAQRYSYNADPKQTYEIQVSAFDGFGEGSLSDKTTATTRSIEDINQFGLSFQPPRLVDTKPTLPDDTFPEGATIYLTTDSTLYKNIGGGWSTDLSDDEYQKLLVGTIEAGAIGVDQLKANSITSDKVGANEIITDMANINNAVIDELQAIEITADMITVGSETEYEEGYNPYEINQLITKTMPNGGKLWHFDTHLTSSQGEMISMTMETL